MHETFLAEAEAETEAFENSFEARPRRGVGRPRGGLETEAPRPRPHPYTLITLSEKNDDLTLLVQCRLESLYGWPLVTRLLQLFCVVINNQPSHLFLQSYIV